MAARKALGAPLRSANLSQRLSTDLGKKGLPMKKRRPGDTRLPEKASRACPSWGMAFGMLLIWRPLAVQSGPPCQPAFTEVCLPQIISLGGFMKRPRVSDACRAGLDILTPLLTPSQK